MGLIMDVSVEFLEKNRQYRVVHMDCEYYILDVESSIWPIFIPILFWLMPQKIYKVDVETVEKLKTPVKQSNNMSSILLIGIGVSAVLSDRKSTRLNSSHVAISSAVFCVKNKLLVGRPPVFV